MPADTAAPAVHESRSRYLTPSPSPARAMGWIGAANLLSAPALHTLRGGGAARRERRVPGPATHEGTMTAPTAHRRLPAAVLAGVIAIALVVAGCGGDERASGPSCARPGAAFEKPATRLTFRMADATPAQVAEGRRILCARLARVEVDHRVAAAAAGGTLTVDVPRAARLSERAGSAGLFGVGRLAIYDWEANVIGPDGAPAPGDPSVTGGPEAGHSSALSLYDALRRAARRPATVEADNSRAGSVFYAADPNTRQVFPQSTAPLQGAATRSAALAAVPGGVGDRARVYEVKPDTVIVDAVGLNTGASAGAWYVLRDDVALRGAQIVNPEQRHDEGPGATGEPVVRFEFTAAGRAPWQGLTRELADRGSRSAGQRSDGAANQHFAIVLDDMLVSVPAVDFRMNPGGIDPRTGAQISGGLTIAAARQLAALLAGDPLPAPLVLASARPVP